MLNKEPKQETKARGRNKPVTRKRVMTLGDVIDTYIQDCVVQGYKPSTLQGHRRTFRCFLRWAVNVGIKTVDDFNGETIKKYIAYLQQKRRWEDNAYVTPQKDTLSPTTVRNYVRDLKAFASWLERENYTTGNVLAKVKKPKADEVPVSPFSKEELDALFSILDVTDSFQFRDFVILHTLWDTGMRVGELIALTLDDIDLKKCEIRVDHAKWGKWRDIGFGKQTQSIWPATSRCADRNQSLKVRSIFFSV